MLICDQTASVFRIELCVYVVVLILIQSLIAVGGLLMIPIIVVVIMIARCVLIIWTSVLLRSGQSTGNAVGHAFGHLFCMAIILSNYTLRTT